MARSVNDYRRELERWVRQQQRVQDQFRMGVQRAIEREIRRRYEAWRRQAEQARKADLMNRPGESGDSLI
ncbi:hypothetical protein [Mycobacterium tuberculosis]|uniref:hypothetical protein n=1 Tax=Mycobacterium tuberculosis TaxID=1773 RepID=UPI0039A5DC0B